MGESSTSRRVPAHWWLMVAAGLLVLALVAVLGLVRPWAGDQPPVARFSPTTEPPPAAVLAAIGGQAGPAPTAAGVRAAIDALVRDPGLGQGVSAAVLDPVSGERLYDRGADTPTIPASAIKLITAATVLATRGPAHRLDTVVVAGAEPGEVVLIGGGDPTLSVGEDGFYPEPARLDLLAAQVRDALDGAPVRRVIVDAGLFSGPVHGPWSDDIVTGGFVGPITALMTDGARVDPDPAQEQRAVARWPAPDLAAGEAFAELLGLSPDAVSRGDAPPAAALPAGPGGPAGSGGPAGPGGSTGPAPGGGTAAPGSAAPPADPTRPGTELGRVSSPPLLRLVEYMLANSDNVVAEVLARQVALARGEPASFDGAADAMAATLTELGVPAGAGVRLADGSGLSRDNRLTAALLTALLTAATSGPVQPALAGMVAGLPVAGWSGTLADRYRPGGDGSGGAEPGPGAGTVRAKTGSLDGVNALVGLVVTADGRLLVFALLTDAVPVGPDRARELLDEIAVELAGCGCR